MRTDVCTRSGRVTAPRWLARRSGLTLIELMVVMSIILVLAALLFAVASGARAAAVRTQCTSNLRQLVAAMGMPSEGEIRVGKPHVRDARILICPADHTAPKPPGYTSYEFPRSESEPVALRAADLHILIACNHHGDKGLIAYEGGTVKYQELPVFLKY